jgi:hypothetical protein
LKKIKIAEAATYQEELQRKLKQTESKIKKVLTQTPAEV